MPQEPYVCAYCVGALYHAYRFTQWNVRIRSDRQDGQDEYPAHPSDVIRAIQEGRQVEQADTWQAYSLAITMIDNTVLCGFHAGTVMERRTE
jgi:hypothetical protein